MNITLVIHSLAGGGAERVMAGLANRLADRGHTTTLITLDDGQADRHHVHETVHRVCLDVLSTPTQRVSLAHRMSRLRAAIKQDASEVVLSFCDATNWLVLLATIGLRVPIVVSERSDPGKQSLGRFKEPLRRLLYRRATRVVCLTRPIAEKLAQLTGTQPVVIPSAVEPCPDQWRARRRQALAERSPSDDLQIIAIGRLESEKGFDRLLRCLAKLETLPWHLDLLGEGTQQEPLQRLSRQLGIDQRVRFCGWVQPVWSSLADSDLFVLPSRYEGVPSALLEAMAAGVAVVATDIGGGVREVIRHQQDGWIVANEESALLTGIEKLGKDRGLRDRLGDEAMRSSERFSWEKMVTSYEHVLLDAIAAASAPD